MTSEADPTIGAWYHYPAKSQRIKVTALDDPAATVEVQYFDGAIDELDLDACYGQDIERIEAPEDWEAPYSEEDEKCRAGSTLPDSLFAPTA